jgi:large subunit ribosomal protein L40
MLNRDWAKHKHRQHQQEITFLSRALQSQENALEQLKNESEELYEAAVQVRIIFINLIEIRMTFRLIQN